MEDKNNLIVYCEYDEGRIADVSLELLTKGRTLATRLGCRLEALVLGDKLDGIEQELFPYGVDVVYKVQDDRLFPYTSLPHSSVVTTLFKEIEPQVCLMGATTIGRDLGPRVSSCLHSGLTADCTSLEIHRRCPGQGIQGPVVSDPSRLWRQHRCYHRQPRVPSPDGNRARGCDEEGDF